VNRTCILLFLLATALLANEADRPAEAALFEEMPVVEAASLHSQTLQQAPASVTIITAEDIRKYGYRTFGEALAAVRGFYLTYDRAYHYAGLRGFLLPGDYNTRFLVMLNGHTLTENIYSSNGFFGQDFGLDMDLVQRIEIIRGPSSALYGSNGLFATINIVTRSPVDSERLRLSTETGSFGEKKAHLSSSLELGGGANLLVSASVFNNRGRDLYFPEFDSLQNNHGRAIGGDGERGYHGFANLIWRDWSFTGYFNSREKGTPTGYFGVVFNDSGNKILDSRNFVEAAYSRNLGGGQLRWRLYYDQYRYHGRYDYDEPAEQVIEDTRDVSLGDWAGSQLTYRFRMPGIGDLTVGAEASADIRALQRNYEAFPPESDYLRLNSPDRAGAAFAQQEWNLSRRWKAYLGLRFDHSTGHGNSLTPRVAWIYEHSPRTVYKLLYGRAFRNPNAYESFYDDVGATQVANPRLRPERMETFEAVVERKLAAKMNALATVYHYRLNELIDVVSVGEVFQYQNLSRNRAVGVEMEINGRPWGELETTASLALQRAYDPGSGESLTNSPLAVAKWRAAVPLLRKRMYVSAGLQYLSSRLTLGASRVEPMWLPDVTLTSNRLHRDFDVQLGIRNVWNSRYSDPVGMGQPMDSIRADGRSFFVKLIWHRGE
jgi:outer membrane cobalamin receptor